MSAVKTTPNGAYATTPGHARKPSARVLAHINDLQNAAPQVDLRGSLSSVLDRVESLLAEAKGGLNFNRPDNAFRAYLQASVILIKRLPSHRDYPAMDKGPPALKRRYQGLVNSVADLHKTFEMVKQKIITDNELHGTKPQNAHEMIPRISQDAAPMDRPVQAKKEKPIVQPKPRALHGNAINNRFNPAAPTDRETDSLQKRFSKLGGPAASPGQDPRIRTHPPLMPPQNAGLDGGFGKASPLPKLPDAIYSPARGTLSEEAAALPTSTPRAMFSRSTTSPSVSKVSSSSKTDYFSAVQTPPSSKKSSFAIPEGDTVAPEELCRLLQSRAKVLLIDVRDREEFDEGHIISQTIICIEPSILIAEDVTADVVRDRMSIGPDAELELFDRRDTFDLVVFYDASSTSIPSYMKSRDGNPALLSLQRILTKFSIDKRVDPKLLHGGLQAWTDLLGERNLDSTKSASSGPRRPAAKPMPGRNKTRYDAGAVSSADVSRFTRDLVRSPSEFIQKFPEISTEPVSMTQPTRTDHSTASPPRPPVPLNPPPRPPKHPIAHDVPLELAKPAPTAAKIGTSGLHPVGEPVSSRRTSADDTSPTGQHITGLINPGTWCFANSTVQALRLSPGFGRELARKNWQASWKIPRLAHEKEDHPQLMARIVANLFQWLSSGSFVHMKAKTLMDYSGSLTSRSNGSDFSGRSQQDAQEFLSFLMDALSQETNLKRNVQLDPPKATSPDHGKSPLQGTMEHWVEFSKQNDSIIDKYFTFVDVTITTCQNCRNVSYRYEENQVLIAPLPRQQTASLEDCIKTPQSTVDGYKCDRCGEGRRALIEYKLGRMPELLCVQLGRFQFEDASQLGQKLFTQVNWDLNNINLEPRFLPHGSRQLPPNAPLDEHYQGPFHYECYAVITHRGSTITSGHYYTYARGLTSSEPNAWYELNDSHVTRVQRNEIFGSKTSNATPYLAFFRRKHGGSSSAGGRL